ncbi:MAG: hypothetical protein ACI8Q1_001856 [Parvicella sp.]|jgi:hypothetical protein
MKFTFLILFLYSLIVSAQSIENSNLIIIDTLKNIDCTVLTDYGSEKKPDKLSWICLSDSLIIKKRKDVCKHKYENVWFSISPNKFNTLLLEESLYNKRYKIHYESHNRDINVDGTFKCEVSTISKNLKKVDYETTNYVYCIIRGEYLNENINKYFEKSVWYSFLIPLPTLPLE